MTKRVLALFIIVGLLTPFAAFAHGKHWHKVWNKHYKPRTEVVDPKPAPSTPTTPTSPTVQPSGQEKAFNAYVTGYSYWDNTPPGSADISHGVIHTKAGGTGTYQDPITLAVGHSIIGGKDILDYPAGTKFYFPFLKKYVIVEDTCGDGNQPQNGPCHTGKNGNPWLDVYVGKGASKAASDSCMYKITGVHQVIQSPISTYPVVTGDIAANCTVY